jgi:hypothetical protein
VHQLRNLQFRHENEWSLLIILQDFALKVPKRPLDGTTGLCTDFRFDSGHFSDLKISIGESESIFVVIFPPHEKIHRFKNFTKNELEKLNHHCRIKADNSL